MQSGGHDRRQTKPGQTEHPRVGRCVVSAPAEGQPVQIHLEGSVLDGEQQQWELLSTEHLGFPTCSSKAVTASLSEGDRS